MRMHVSMVACANIHATCSLTTTLMSDCCTGTTFTYLRSSLLLVQDQTKTQSPPFMFDTTLGKPGFVDPSGAPVTVTLTTKVCPCMPALSHAWPCMQ
jgi:hypothetical protein